MYASNKDTAGTQAVRRLNPKGEDVIRMGQTKNLGGDMQISGTSQYAGASTIVDVVYREKGIYSLLDSKRGRIITYDHEGNLLYIFGGLGTQAGTMEAPVAIECAGDKMLALDSKQGVIAVFGETEYGRLINEAVGLRYDGDETQAVALWQEVLRMDENNELANTGIGKAYLSAGDNEKAMEYLKRGMNRDYYSVAFKRYRNDVLKSNINYILTGIIAVIVAIVAVLHGVPSVGRLLRIRHGEKGSVAIAILMVVLFGLCFTLNRLLAGFVVNDINERTVNALWEMSGVLMLYLLLCVGNWSITCLMDGEGRLKDIAIAIGYSLLPMIVCYIAATIVSQFVAENEEAFYAIIIFLGTAYTLIMALIGIMQVHNYTLGKTLLTLLLTLVAVFIIIFLMMLIANFIGQVFGFVRSIYTELIFRV